MVVMTLVGAATAFHRNRHIAIVFVVERMPAKAREGLALFSLACCALMFGLLVWYGTRMAWDDYRFDVTSPALGVPQWLYLRVAAAAGPVHRDTACSCKCAAT